MPYNPPRYGPFPTGEETEEPKEIKPSYNQPNTNGPYAPGEEQTRKMWKSVSESYPEGMKLYSMGEYLQGKMQEEGRMPVPYEWGRAMIRQWNAPNQAYFAQDPKRLAKFHTFIKNAPPNWQPPEWLDTEKFEQAYNYMSDVYGSDWKTWEQLPEDDPTNIYLTTLLTDPPIDFQLPSEINNQEEFLKFISELPVGDQGIMNPAAFAKDENAALMNYLYGGASEEQSPFMEPGAWDRLETWQKWALTFLSPQPMPGRPEISRLAASGFQGLQAGMGGWYATTMLLGATAGTAITPGVGTIAGTALGLLAGGALAVGAGYQAYTGTEIPGLNTLLRILDYPDEFFERIIGIGIQAAGDDTKEVLSNLPDAFRAGQFAYEASPVGVGFLNIMSGGFQIAEDVFNQFGSDVDWSSGTKADYKAGQIWALEKAIVEPVLVRGGLLGGAALDEVRSRLASGEAVEDIYMDYYDRFGYSGNIGDFILQSVLDPLQSAPWVANTVMGKIAKVTNNPVLASAVKHTRGKLDVDILPFGVQSIYSAITGRPGTAGMFDTLRQYKNTLRQSTLPIGEWPTHEVGRPVSLWESHPDLFDGADVEYNRILSQNVIQTTEGGVATYEFDTINQQFRSFIEEKLTSVDIDVNQTDVRAAIDDAIEYAPDVIRNTLLNEPGTTEAEYKANLKRAFQDYFDEKIGDIQTGEKGVMVPYYPEMTPWERKFAKLTDEGAYIELQPGLAKNWFQKLRTLTPESQAILSLYMTNDNTNALLSMHEGNPEGMISFLKQAGSQDSIEVGQKGEIMLKSPATKTIAPALKAFDQSGILDEMLTVYNNAGDQRSEIQIMSRALGQTDYEMLSLIDTNPDTVIQMIQNSDQRALKDYIARIENGTLTAESLNNDMSIFLGDDYVPLHPTEFQAQLMQHLNKFLDKWMVERYGIKPKPWIFRMSSALKSFQSLAVLGFNPLYFIYNYVNNMGTRAAQGVFGFMTPKQIGRFSERFGFLPAKFNVGIGLEARSDYTHKGGAAISAAMDVNDWTGKLRKAGSKAAKLGIFSNLAARVEVSESRQATMIGMKQMWDSTWKPGIGFEKLPADVEAELRSINPKWPERIYKLASQGLNIDEVYTSLYNRAKYEGLQSNIDRAIQQVYTNSPGIGQDLLTKSGIDLALADMIGENPTIDDINYAYDYIDSHLDSIVEEMYTNDLAAIPEDIRNRVRSEGMVAMMPVIAEFWGHFTTRRLQDIIDNQITAQTVESLRSQGDFLLARQEWQTRIAKSDRQWTRTHTAMLAAAKGMFDAVDTTDPATHRYVNVMREWMNDWELFYADKNLEYSKFFDSKAEGPERKALWKATEERVAKLYDKHTELQKNQLTRMFEELSVLYEETSHRPGTEVIEWSGDVIRSFEAGTKLVSEFRETLRNTDLPANKVRQAFETFNTETFKPSIIDTRNALIEGAYRLSQLRPEEPTIRPGTPLPVTEGMMGMQLPEGYAKVPLITALPPGEMPPVEAGRPAPIEPTRPSFEGAETLRSEINKRAANIGDDFQATNKQRTMLARLIGDVYKNTEERHAVQRYLFDTASVKTAKGSKVKAALDLFISIDEQGQEVYRIPDNIREQLANVLEAARTEEGQGSVFDKPADNASDADKAIYNEADTRKKADDAIEEQKTHAQAVMTRRLFKEKIKTAFDLTREQQSAVMALVEAHAEVWGSRNGKKADDWFRERIEDVERFDLDDLENKLGMKAENHQLGEMDLLENGKHIIRGYRGSDVETAVHELAHVFRYELTDADLDTYVAWSGYDGSKPYGEVDQLWRKGKLKESDPDYQAYVDAENKFADGFVAYNRDLLPLDIAPPKMRSIFQKFSDWIMRIHHAIVDQGGDVFPFDAITPEMQSVYDSLLFKDSVIDMRRNLSTKLTHMPTGQKSIAMGVVTKTKYNVQYKIVELADLVTSHDINYKLREAYPQELQTKSRDLLAYRNQVNEIVVKFAPDEMLFDTGLSDVGTPIIGSDMVVESGNGRTIALLQMAKNYPEKWASYVDTMRNYLDDYGFSPDAIEGMENPVLVRQRLDDVDRIAFAQDANAKRKASPTSIEQALLDAEKWSDEMLAKLQVGSTQEIDNAILSPTNAEVLNQFKRGIPPEELGDLIDADGILTIDGLQRVKNSLMAKIFRSESGKRILRLFGESSDPLVTGFKRVIERTLGDLASLEAMINDGRRPEDYRIADDVADVINSYLLIKKSSQTIDDWFIAENAFEADRYLDIQLYDIDTPEDIRNYKIELLHFFTKNRDRQKPQAEFIKRYVNSIKEQPEMAQISLLDVGRPDKPMLAKDTLQSVVRDGLSNSFLDYVKPGDEAKPPSLFQTRVIGETPLYGTPAPLYEGRMTEEAYLESLTPLLNQMRDIALDDMVTGTAFSLGDLPDDVSNSVQEWMTRLPEQMAGTKMAAMRYGEMMRDRSLLNYQERYGIDDYTQMIFPYEFWFTRTMGEWAKRMIEKPAWFSMYARIREHQKRMEQEGIPTRLKDKFRIPAPYLPDFMGDAIYVDPLKQLFPFAQFSTPLEMSMQTGQNVEYAAIQKIQQMVKDKLITAKQAQKAIEDRDGPLWNQVMAEAQVEARDKGDLDAMSLASMMLTPAMWWTYPYHILKGTPEQLYPLPGTRTGQALRTLGGPLGVIGNILALPEETIRKKFNLSTFGEWGDYYVDRMLANLAAEGEYSTKDILLAMIERRGDAYDEAYRRVEIETALKIPGSQTALAIKDGNLGAILYTLPTTFFPAGLLPEGELLQRNLKVEYSKAWDEYKNGDPRAVNKFFEDHPEYQARLALWDKPEERLRQFLVSEIWGKYQELESKNKPLVIDQLGENFERMFLDKETRDYTAIDIETLAYWAQLLGGIVPEVEETGEFGEAALYQQDRLKLYRPEVIAEVEEFQAQRDELFPDYKFYQDIYWSLPEKPNSIRKEFLEQNPWLKEYWEYKDDYYDKHPNVKAYMEEQKKRYDNNEQIYTTGYTEEPIAASDEELTARIVSQNMIPALQLQVLFSHYAGKELEGGARTLLYQYWISLGSPGEDFEAWLYMLLGEMVR